MAERKAFVERDTLETQIKASINLDCTGKARFDIGVPFLEHMLDQIARHGLFDLDIESKGDLHIDDHHTVEDVGITLGQAFSKAIGDCRLAGGGYSVGVGCVGDPAEDGGSVPLSSLHLIVPTLRVGMPPVTLCVTFEVDAERPGLYSHAERGSDQR